MLFDSIRTLYTKLFHDNISMSYDGYDDLAGKPILTQHTVKEPNLMESRTPGTVWASDPLADIVYSISTESTKEFSSNDNVLQLLDAVTQLAGVVSGLPGAAVATTPIITQLTTIKTAIEAIKTGN